MLKASKKAKKQEGELPAAKPKKVKKVKVLAEPGAEPLKVKKKKRKPADDAAAEPPKPKKAKLKVASPAASDSATSEQSGLQVAPAAAAPPAAAAADPLALDNFPLAGGLKELLRGKGIASLFPIQAQTLASVLDGADLVGRARCAFHWTAFSACACLAAWQLWLRTQGCSRAGRGLSCTTHPAALQPASPCGLQPACRGWTGSHCHVPVVLTAHQRKLACGRARGPRVSRGCAGRAAARRWRSCCQ